MNAPPLNSRWLEVETRSPAELETLAEQCALFALIDACDAPEVPAMWQIYGTTRAASLYAGDSEKQYATFAPYLFQVDMEILAWMQRSLWQTPWGVFVLAPQQSLEDLRRHFRQFLLVQNPQGEEMYFRFYDPRVLANFLPLCERGELRALFGPVAAYGIPGENGVEIAWHLETGAVDEPGRPG